MDEERRTVIRTLNKLANDYLVYPDETKALDYAIKEMEMPSRVDWHRFSEETPDNAGLYLVTYTNGTLGFERYVPDVSGQDGFFSGALDVAFWAELPDRPVVE